MTCATCGRENPPHLTFCQECGQRLGPRIAPPTPPIGLGSDGAPPDLHAPRPVAPDPFLQSPPRGATALGGTVAHPGTPPMPAPAPPAHAGAPKRCAVCDTVNPANLRYCTSCGSTLDTAPAAEPAQAHAPPAHAPPAAAPTPRLAEPGAAPAPAPVASPFGGPPPPPISPMRVVDLAGGQRAPEAQRTCGRCRGVVDANAQFCKFCGAPLAAEPPPEPPRANGPPPAPRAPAAASLQATIADPNPPAGMIAALAAAAAAPPPPPPPAPPVAAAPPPPVAAAPPPPPPPPAPPAPAPAPPVAAAPPPVAPAHEPARPASAPAFPPVGVGVAPAAVHQAPTVQRPVTRGRLVVIAKSGADGPSYPIGDTLDVGRVEGNVIVAEDPYLSPRHVRITWKNDHFVLRDLASTNGVFLRLVAARDMHAGKGHRPPAGDAGAPGEVAVPLRDQDLILVGQQVLRFETVKEGEAGLGPAMEHGTLLFGSPAAPRYARLGQRTVEGVTRDVYYVRKVETVLGRESGDVVFTEDPFLSRRHAAVRVLGPGGAPLASAGKPGAEPAGFALVDLGSSNGTFLKIRDEVDLVPGDHFRVGQQLFRVDFDATGRAQ